MKRGGVGCPPLAPVGERTSRQKPEDREIRNEFTRQCGGEFLCFPMGHPLHPMLITLPIGLFVATFLFDLILWQAGTEHWATNALWRRGQV